MFSSAFLPGKPDCITKQMCGLPNHSLAHPPKKEHIHKYVFQCIISVYKLQWLGIYLVLFSRNAVEPAIFNMHLGI